MSYFTALLSRNGGGTWRARDVDVEGHEDVESLTQAVRLASGGDAHALLLLEHEDEWFALARVDDGDDTRVFVSDAAAAAASPYGPALGLDPEVDEDSEPSGDSEVVADAGTPSEELLRLAGEDGIGVSEAVAAVAEAAGFGEVLDAM
ncbi:tRNA adenosine deaminase-associated protein, partial [Motilibacter deserti]